MKVPGFCACLNKIKKLYDPWSISLGIAILIIGGVTTYFNSFSGVFLYDDLDVIVNNPRIQSLWPITDKLGIADRENVFLTFAASCHINRVFGLPNFHTLGFHLINLLIHLSAGLCLFGIVRQSLCSPNLAEHYSRISVELATIISLCWLVHPLHTQAVTYIVQRMESQMGLFYLLTIYLIIRGWRSRRRNLWFVLAIIACLFGMGSKEGLITIPAIVLLYDKTFVSYSFRIAIKRHWFLYVALIFSAAGIISRVYFPEKSSYDSETSRSRYIDSSKVAQPVLLKSLPKPKLFRLKSQKVVQRDASAWRYIATMSKIQLYYIKLAVWPNSLCFDYMWRSDEISSKEILSVLAVIVLIMTSSILMFKGKIAGFIGFSYWVYFSPRYVIHTKEYLYEHHMYLPTALIVIAFVMSAVKIGPYLIKTIVPNLKFKRQFYRVAGLLGSTLLIILLGFLTISRNADYHNSLKIWAKTVYLRPENPRALSNLGCALIEAQLYREAEIFLLKATELMPDYTQAQCNLGSLYGRLGQPEKAIIYLERACKKNPSHPGILSNLGNVYVDLGRYDEAIICFQKALSIHSNFEAARYNMERARSLQQRSYRPLRHEDKVSNHL